MSETALYRKYRPSSFKDVIGQEHVVSVLQGAIKGGTIAHAYLFSGSRGTGKTSVARIFAEEIGCSANDLYEIDAASNRGIDDVRELRESVNTLPFESPYKVYIIDEVHMLTKEAFNALLKTLEEPPQHAVFILATTELDKLPETVVSRCQTFVFRKPTEQILRDVVLRIGKKEGHELESAAADLIAMLGDGSFRDTIGLLQKVIGASKAAGKISVEQVELVTGAPQSSLVRDVVASIHESDLGRGVAAISKAADQNVDMKVFLRLILARCRQVLLMRFAGAQMTKTIEAESSEADFAFLKKVADEPKSGITSRSVTELLTAENQTARASVPTLPLELALMRLCEKVSEKGSLPKA